MERNTARFVVREHAVTVLAVAAWLLCVSCLFLNRSCGAEGNTSDVGSVSVDNYVDGETQSYPIALLKGRVSCHTSEYVVVENLSSAKKTRISRVKAFRGEYKALIELTPGDNFLTISDGNAVKQLKIVYEKSAEPYFVRLVYFKSSDAVVTTDDAELSQKLRIAGMLWQTATAESFHDAGLERRTFTLEFDENDNVLVWIQHGKRKSSDYRSLTENERFRTIYQEVISGNIGTIFAKYFVMIDSVDRKSFNIEREGRTALGGGSVGMLDSSTFFTWPTSLESVATTFLDPSSIEETYLFDSAYRNYYWALTSSSLGAGLHELGHALGLEHLDDPNDYMSRGFDKFNRVFTVCEPYGDNSINYFKSEDVARWGQVNTAKLLNSPWIKK